VNNFSKAVLILSAVLLGACASTPESLSIEDSRPALDRLSQAQAHARKARVSEITYALDVDLVSQADAYLGTVGIEFLLKGAEQNLNIDFTGGAVSQVMVNGSQVEVNYNGFFIKLPAAALADGANQVEITYSHPFDQDGTGLHRFVDPEDGATYLYTYLWPYYANRLFPNFDQPNLKAQYELTVKAAADWQVFSAMQEDSVTRDGETATWHFPQSKKFSSYVFSLHAGPYKVWQDKAGDVPIRLLARQSLAQYVAVDEWMTTTKAGLAYYKDYFGIEYPFVKYDQVIVPDFLIGAMENVAAVTFAESYVDRGTTNRFLGQRRANTILHEMAHMWFGDLVTKNWWNGLWLNESFATLMSNIAVAEITPFTDLWHDFYLSTNLGAIAADERVSTHPIEVKVNSTADFFDVFDSITYEKGASVLNQLSHYIGRENFRLGVSGYLQKHSWGNTELKDFIDALSEQSKTNLTAWSKDWMYQAGVNTLEAQFACSDERITGFSILQTATDEYPTLRSQRLQLGLFNSNAKNKLAAYAVLPTLVSGSKTEVPEAIGLDCPELAFPNYEGWGYANVRLDNISMATLLDDEAIDRINDPLLRSMLWTSMFSAASEKQIPNARLLSELLNKLSTERNDRVIRQLLGGLIDNLDNLERKGQDHEEELREYSKKAERVLWKPFAAIIEASKGNPRFELDQQGASTFNLWLTSYTRIARSDEALDSLLGMLDKLASIPESLVGQNTRWSLILRLAERGHPQAKNLLASERKADASDGGHLAAIAAEAALPDAQIKAHWVDRFLDQENPLPLSNQRAAMNNIFPSGQESFQRTLITKLAAAVPEQATSRDNYFLRSYAQSLFSGICDAESLAVLSGALTDRETIGNTLYRFLSENKQSAEKCLGV
jgi:aminopeptidase N